MLSARSQTNNLNVSSINNLSITRTLDNAQYWGLPCKDELMLEEGIQLQIAARAADLIPQPRLYSLTSVIAAYV